MTEWKIDGWGLWNINIWRVIYASSPKWCTFPFMIVVVLFKIRSKFSLEIICCSTDDRSFKLCPPAFPFGDIPIDRRWCDIFTCILLLLSGRDWKLSLPSRINIEKLTWWPWTMSLWPMTPMPQSQSFSFSDLNKAMTQPDRAKLVASPTFTEPTSLCLSFNGPTLFSSSDRWQLALPQPLHMSAIALLYKAAQMGIVAPCFSLFHGFGLGLLPSSSTVPNNLEWVGANLGRPMSRRKGISIFFTKIRKNCYLLKRTQLQEFTN